MASSNAPDSSTSTRGSIHVEPPGLDLDALPRPRPDESESLERSRPGGVSYEEYFRFLKQFRWTEEQIRAIPLATGPRFTLE